jgi:hypothetical protein
MIGRNMPVRIKGHEGETVPRYVCGGYFARGKAKCYFNSIDERPLLVAVLRKLKERFTPEFFELVRTALRARTGADITHGDDARLSRRIAELGESITRATRKLIAEDDARIADAYRIEIQKDHEERDRLTAEVENRQRHRQSPTDPDAEVDASLALLARLDEALPRAEPAEIRSALRDMVERIDLWYEHEHTPRETRCRFVRDSYTSGRTAPSVLAWQRLMQAVQEARHDHHRLLEPHQGSRRGEAALLRPGIPEQGSSREELEGVPV